MMASRPLVRRISLWGPVVAYVVMIFYFSSLSRIAWAAAYPDYLEHGVEYAGLAVLLARALNRGLRRPFSMRVLLLTFLLCVAYGASDEFHQKFVPNRFADVTDVLSDSLGAAAGLAVVSLGRRILAVGGAQ